jgi:hypothetical protein
LANLIISPYSLELNEGIYAKIIAYNFYGDSAYSPEGNGGQVKLVPDTPINLLNDASTTTDLTIRFTWSEGASNGGVSILDYHVYYDQGSSTWIFLASTGTDKFYQTSVTLNAGNTYSFKVVA